jgi:hypothetical protein
VCTPRFDVPQRKRSDPCLWPTELRTAWINVNRLTASTEKSSAQAAECGFHPAADEVLHDRIRPLQII